MTDQLPATRQAAPRPPIMAGGQIAALVPQTLDEAFRVAQAIAASGLAPRGLDKPEQVMVAIMAGAELGLAPFQALQSFAIVNNRPTLWGDGLMAVARAQGIKAREWIDGVGDQAVASCEVTRPDTGEIIRRSFSVADAKKAALWNKQGPWQSYPKRMLQMRARAWALRDGCADMLRGFQVREEVEDFQPMTARQVPADAPNLSARLAAPREEDAPREGFSTIQAEFTDTDAATPPEAASEPALDDGAGDLSPDAPQADGAGEAAEPAEPKGDDETGSAADLLAWAQRLIEDLPGLNRDQIEAILASENEVANFTGLEATQPQVAMDLQRAIKNRQRELA
ncbi:hypothetical protein ASG17_07765 [Brevundimonas sp. Leaf363]|uniref:hypothetical protein n=1 Tax=Brevundimonas sp. Leaf363 TaxID=1736353 RepID=UPI0006FFDAF7|nr:hypothetical protein [Brevundimonas sp. Leaf363]KQS55939.1 hypothetical protein ASG17_07765 [Brevundimonas sp. Leaf363]